MIPASGFHRWHLAPAISRHHAAPAAARARKSGKLVPFLMCDDGTVIEVPVDQNGDPIPGYVDANGRYVPVQ